MLPKKDETQSSSHILADIDGVILEPFVTDGDGNTIFAWTQNLQKDLGINPTELSKLFTDSWHDVITGKKQLKEQVAMFLANIQRDDIDPDVFISYWFSHDGRINNVIVDALRLASEQGHDVSLATNQEERRIKYLMDTHPLDFIGQQFTSSRLGVAKPDLVFFKRIVDVTGLDYSEMILIDDSLNNIKAAQKLGMKALHVTKTDSDTFARQLAELLVK